ncbi:MAG: RdgB/HAM1 family non-canonical purine NTP pyrophosphatase [Salinivirgaceae bacterium]|jgi:XTP/dITP diphosphohydrolase|nr:RdgB/HAM1 family non-canonical purine NTP pyrophosphatase [Salinivirgaceae bacterium]
MEKLIFATNNEHKLTEVKQMLNGLYEVQGLFEAGINEDIPENEPTLQGNAKTKAQYVHKILNANVIADDTGLEIKSLNNQPGVYSARYAGSNKDSVANMNKVLHNMIGEQDRQAQFRTSICLILNNEPYFFEGIVKGNILEKPTGKSGFGYDPIFQPENYTTSFAQMDMIEKNKISHRGLAIQKLVAFLKTQTK